ncbi:LpxI family protein, partial [bacterium]|nr:LpxI family protein [bacterium]
QLDQDIQSGWVIAKNMGGLDIGQAITIKDGIVIAVEAIEGTDACIERTGDLCKRGGWTLVKVSKPDQDMRFDVPTIGPQTVQRVRTAGGKAIAIEADKTIVVDQQKTYALADSFGISILALRDQPKCSLQARCTDPAPDGNNDLPNATKPERSAA